LFSGSAEAEGGLRMNRMAVVSWTLLLAAPAAFAQVTIKGKRGAVEINDGTVRAGGERGQVEVTPEGVELTGGERAARTARPAGADQPLRISGNSVTRTLSCDEGTPRIEINGSSHQLTIRGDCKEIEVNGSSHDLQVERAAKLIVTGSSHAVRVEQAGQITVSGIHNQVRYQKGLGKEKKPRTQVSGLQNAVAQQKD
jgi:hypothetical protein